MLNGRGRIRVGYVVGAVLAAGMMLNVFYLYFSATPVHGMARVVEESTQVGDVPVNEEIRCGVKIKNVSNVVRTVYGASDSCRESFCISTLDLPLQIEPGATATVQFDLKCHRQGEFSFEHSLYIGDEHVMEVVPILLRGVGVENAGAPVEVDE